MAIAYNDRVFVAGPTGSGKSELLNAQFSQVRCQRLLYDTKDEFSIRDVDAVTDPAAIDWNQPTIHVRGQGGPDEAEELFAHCNRRRRIVVCVHELGDICDDTPSRIVGAFQQYVRKGRAHGRGLLGGSQRPVGMPRVARTEAQHIFYVLPRLDPEDHKIVARMTEAGGRLEPALAHAEALSPDGRHGFVWYDKQQRTARASGPLPEHVRKRSVVSRTTIA